MFNKKYIQTDKCRADAIAMVPYPTIAAADAALKLRGYPFEHVRLAKRGPTEDVYIEAIRVATTICAWFCEFGAGLFAVLHLLPWTRPMIVLETPRKRGILISPVWVLCASVRIVELSASHIFAPEVGFYSWFLVIPAFF